MAKTKKVLVEARKKKPRGVPLSAYVDPELRARVEKVATDSGVTISYAVRELVVAGLEYYEG